jgi:hypothetical protein
MAATVRNICDNTTYIGYYYVFEIKLGNAYYVGVTSSYIEKRKYCLIFMQRYSVAFRYRENAQRLSRIYLDQPLTPLEQAVYWTEYVIRHNGAPDMRSAVLDLAWYQYLLLDVIAVLALAIVSVLLFLLLVCRAILKCVFGGKSQEKSADSRRKKLN